MIDGRKPTAPPHDIADIERFFTHGLNTTPAEFKEHLAVLRSAFDIERDQDQEAVVPADMLLDLFDIAGRLVDIWEDTTHILQVRPGFLGGGYSMQHPVRCRKTGLLECDWWKTVEAHIHEGGELPAPGSYPISIRWVDHDDDPDLVPEGFEPLFMLTLGDRIPCERDTNGDGDCGARYCPYCGEG